MRVFFSMQVIMLARFARLATNAQTVLTGPHVLSASFKTKRDKFCAKIAPRVIIAHPNLSVSRRAPPAHFYLQSAFNSPTATIVEETFNNLVQNRPRDYFLSQISHLMKIHNYYLGTKGHSCPSEAMTDATPCKAGTHQPLMGKTSCNNC